MFLMLLCTSTVSHKHHFAATTLDLSDAANVMQTGKNKCLFIGNDIYL